MSLERTKSIIENCGSEAENKSACKSLLRQFINDNLIMQKYNYAKHLIEELQYMETVFDLDYNKVYNAIYN